MDDEIDHLKEFEAIARQSLSKGHVLLAGLDAVRAHQRGEYEVTINRPGAIPYETRQAVRDATGTTAEIAALFRISRATVIRFRAEPY